MTRAKRKMNPKARGDTAEICLTEGCEDAVVYKEAGLCSACYAYDYFWTRYKGAGERRTHQKKLTIRQARMERISITSRPRLVKKK